MSSENVLFAKYQLNHLFTLKNKILMAPMTRAKADNDLVPTKAMAEYYARRAEAGLIITEGTVISPDALGYSNVPGIFNVAQINKWRSVTDAVHENNGLIFMQIWHVGRVSNPHFLKGKLPVSPSATTMTGRISRSEGLTYGQSRAVTLKEIKELINSYAIAAENAIKAGFDGVEIHGANGYLIDQFLHYHTNKRDDEYGGSPQNMARFALDVVKACGEAIGYDRIGLRLSPGAYLNEIVGEKRDALVFKYLFGKLNDYPIAYVHTGNFNDAQQFEELDNMTMTAFIRFHYDGTVVAAGGYTIDAASEGISLGNFDLVAIGRPFISNPDLIIKLRNNETLTHYDSNMLNTLY